MQEAIVKPGGMELLGKIENDVLYEMEVIDCKEKAMQKVIYTFIAIHILYTKNSCCRGSPKSRGTSMLLTTTIINRNL